MNFIKNFLQITYKVSLEIQNSVLSVIVGLVFILNGSRMYERFPDTYQFIEFAPPYVWGVIYAAAGIAHLLCLFTGLKYLRKQVLITKSGLWLFLAVCVMFSDRYTPSGYFFLVFSVSAFLSFLRIKILKTEVYASA